MRRRLLVRALLLACAATFGRPPPGLAQADFVDLAVAIVSSPGPVPISEEIEYTVTVTNVGTGTALGTTVLVRLPTRSSSGVRIPPASTITCPAEGGPEVQLCRLGDLEAGASVELVLSALVDEDVLTPASGGFVSATAIAASASGEAHPADNEASVLTEILVADLSIAIETDVAFAFSGDPVEHTVTVTNLGPDAGVGATVVVGPFPAGSGVGAPAACVAYLCGDAGGRCFRCSLDPLAAGEQQEIHLGEGLPETALGDVVRRARIAFARGDPEFGNNRAFATTAVLRNVSADAGDSFAPDVAVAGDDLYVTWRDGPALASTPAQVLVRASNDRGATFGPAQALAVAPPFSGAFTPDAAAAGDRAFVVMEEAGEVFLAISEDAGASFPVKFELTADPGESGLSPVIAAEGDRVFVLWQGDGADGPGLYLVRNDPPQPADFFAAQRLADPPVGLVGSHEIAVAGERVYVAWVTETSGGAQPAFEVFLRASSDGGQSFGPLRNLSAELGGGPVLGQTPQLAASGGDLYLSWTTESGQALLAVSDDGGETFQVDDLAPVLGAILPAIAADQGNLYVVWRANAGADLFFSTSRDRGANFAAPQVLLAGRTGLSQTPNLVAAGPRAYAAGVDATTGNLEVFLARKAAGLELRALEVVQSVQTWRNDVPLVADKDTFVRAHIDSFEPEEETIRGCLRGFFGGLELPGSPLESDARYPALSLEPGGASLRRGATGDSPYFRLPPSWTVAGDLRLRFELQAPRESCAELPPPPEPPGGPRLFCGDPAEPGGTADDCSVDVTFEDVPPLEVRFVKILWEGDDGTRHFVDDDEIFDLARRTTAILPVAELPVFVHDGKSFIQQHFPVRKPFQGIGCNFAPDVQTCWVLPLVEELRVREGCGQGCRTRYYGVIPDSNVGGLAYQPGRSGVGSFYADTGRLRHVQSHELMHNLGIDHTLSRAIDLDDDGVPDVNQGRMEVPGPCGEGPEKPSSSTAPPDFPYITRLSAGRWHASISPIDAAEDRRVYGLDPVSPFRHGPGRKLLRPWEPRTPRTMDPVAQIFPDFDTAEVMSYCVFSTAYHAWTSDVSYEAARDALVAGVGVPAGAGAAAARHRLIQGQVDTTSGEAVILPLGELDTASPPAIPPASEYTLELRDAGGVPIDVVPLQLQKTDDQWPVTGWPVSSFIVARPFDPAVAEVAVMQGATELTRRVASPSPPSVQVIFPNGGELLEGGEATLRWDAADADGDDLSFVVEFSPDDGASWQTLAMAWPDTTLPLPLESLRGTDRGRIRVMAQDGFHVGVDESDASFRVANRPPIVSLESPARDSVYLGDRQIVFRARALDPEDGAIPDAAVRWSSSLDGPLGAGAALVRSASELSEGAHAVSVEVADSDGAVSRRTINLGVYRDAPDDATPVADAGPDLHVDEGSVVFLNGAGSGDEEGAALSFLWAQRSGPRVVLSSPLATTPWFVAPRVAGPAELAFELRVWDGASLSLPDEVSVHVADTLPDDTPPLADAGADRTVGSGAFVSLDGTGSSDPDGNPLSYAWTQTGGPAVILVGGDTPRPGFTSPIVSGEVALAFELVVNDGRQDSAPDAVEITVAASAGTNLPPVADAGSGQSVFEGAQVVLDGGASSDPDGGALSYAWTQTGGPAVGLVGSDGPRPGFTAPAVDDEAVLGFELVVGDGVASSQPASVEVRVFHRNRLPDAEAGDDQVAEIGDTVVLDAAASSDFEGDALSFAWSQVVGPAVALVGADTATPSFVAPDVAGDSVLTFQVVVSDAEGGRFDAVNVVVLGSGTPPPSPGLGDVIDLSESAASRSSSDRPQIARSADAIHVVWIEQNPSDILYRGSADGGETFGPILNLSGGADVVDEPEVASNGSDVFAVWEEGAFPDIGVRLARSTDAGATFAPAIDVSRLSPAQDPRIAVSGDDVYVVWRGGDEPREVYLAVSRDRGASFQEPVNLSNSAGLLSESPTVAAAGSDVYVAWNENYETVVRRSGDRAAGFAAAQNLSRSAGFTVNLQTLAVDGPDVYVAWQEVTSGRNDVFLAHSGDGGASFGAATNLSDSFGVSSRPKVAASGGNVHVVWEDDSPGNGEVLVRSSRDAGASFGDALDLSNDSATSLLSDRYGSVAADGGDLFVVWPSEAGGFLGADTSVFARVSQNGGVDFGETLDLSANDFVNISGSWFAHPEVVAGGGVAYAVWEEDAESGNQRSARDVFFRRFGAGSGPGGENTPPIADAGSDQEVPEGAAVVLDGSGSSDADGDPLDFAWTQLGGPLVLLERADTVAPGFPAPDVEEDALLTFQLVVRDGEGPSRPDAVTIRVRAAAPDDSSPAAFSQSLVIAPDESVLVTLAGSDPDGDVLGFAIVEPPHDGAASGLVSVAPDRATVTYQPDPGFSGMDAFRFRVADATGESPPAVVSIEVSAVGAAPIRDLAARPKDGKVDLVWTPPAGAAGYDVYRGGAPGGPYLPIALGHTTDVATYADFDVTDGVTYFYVVRWRDAQGAVSLFSNEASAEPAQRRSRSATQQPGGGGSACGLLGIEAPIALGLWCALRGRRPRYRREDRPRPR